MYLSTNCKICLLSKNLDIVSFSKPRISLATVIELKFILIHSLTLTHSHS